MPAVDLITPNLHEAEELTGMKPLSIEVSNRDELDEHFIRLAEKLLLDGAKAVLIKGGHAYGEFCQDYFTDGKQKWWFTSPRAIAKPFHGTGCTLSSAIASAIAKGEAMLDAVVIAKAYINQAIATAPCVGTSTLPLGHFKSAIKEEYLPWATLAASEGRNRPSFEQDRELGFYPIVSRAENVIELIQAGAKTIQLRIKDLEGDALETEIESAVGAAENAKVRLYVNDHWRTALSHRAYGVHLGQSDLDDADIHIIQDVGLRLGISTHSHFEVSRALSFRPSYIAIGPIHPTTTKEMPFEPQGVSGFAYWADILNYPLVAIGGIFLNNAAELLNLGADGIAVVRDIANCSDRFERTQLWLSLFTESQLVEPTAYEPLAVRSLILKMLVDHSPQSQTLRTLERKTGLRCRIEQSLFCS